MFKFRFGGQGDNSPTQPPSIETVRRSARHRLLGATVLVLAGVIGFPLLFESQPRPVPADFEVDIPSRQPAKSNPLAGAADSLPAAPVGGLDESEEFVPAAPAAPAAQLAKAHVEPAPPVTPTAPMPPLVKPMPPAPAVQAALPAKPQSEPSARKPAESKPTEPKLAESKPVEPKPAAKPVDKPADKPAKPNDDSARALALLEGKSAPAPAPASDAAKPAAKPRHIVQVGAFVDPNLAQEARAKLERSGLSSYTQISNTPDGPRTRVRLGPFETRAEADKAAAKARALGLSAAILAL